MLGRLCQSGTCGVTAVVCEGNVNRLLCSQARD
eukprot:CAMPEP_0179136978 /NCGR_PEP_ID=MMETSP0796-20121207/65311_1 /TAXON_ID=73915 /ORGANISM="Pyrodinium bahamense, Strain pbaha01" /LENGTH=32 /DNA_ID= /DNA_START= /DNA_END= /DNA_ORIENTATION=